MIQVAPSPGPFSTAGNPKPIFRNGTESIREIGLIKLIEQDEYKLLDESDDFDTDRAL
jgi:hypothetical protein